MMATQSLLEANHGNGPLRLALRFTLRLLSALALAAPCAAATFTVTSNADTAGASCAATCTLRQAITAANSNAGADNITFNVPGSGVRLFTPASAYPALTGPTVIDGYTQPSASANTLAVGSDASILIRIEGGGGIGSAQLDLSGGNSTIRGLSFGNFGSGVSIRINDVVGNSGNVVEGVWIGTTANGIGNAPVGSSIVASGTVNTAGLRIGGSAPAQRNVLTGGVLPFVGPQPAITISSNNAVISNNYIDVDKNGNFDNAAGFPSAAIALRNGARFGGPNTGERNIVVAGVFLGADSGNGVMVEGNYFGVGADGLSPLRVGQTQIDISGGTNHTIRNNVIGSGLPTASGIEVGSSSTPGLRIVGNWIGLGANGVAARPLGTGIRLGAGAVGTVIGGTGSADGNIIANNLGAGIEITAAPATPVQILGNRIGLNASAQPAGNVGAGINVLNANQSVIGSTALGGANRIAHNGGIGVSIVAGTGNRVSGNSIHSNGGLELDLGNGSAADGANANDNLDVDSGGNTRLNHPIFATVTRAGNQITAEVSFGTSANLSGLTLEFYRSSRCDNVGGLGVAQTFVFSAVGLTSTAAGVVAPNISFADANLAPTFYSALLTDANGNTSEISPCVAVPLGLLFLDGFD